MGVVTDILFIALATAVINNLVLINFVGICPFLGVSRRIDTAFGMGCAVTFVITIAGSATWIISHFALVPGSALVNAINSIAAGSVKDLLFLQYIIFIFVIAGMVQLVEMYVRKFAPALYKALGVFLPLITTNCAILFACLTIAKSPELTDNFLFALVYSFFGGIGFTLAIVLMAGIREELETADIPEPLKGPGITLITAGLMALAFMGFKGMAG
ncbi:MAG: electron transport complex subunit RsxA [Phycisphaerae bacterium]|nr:electron transport complex subunit RsxA [Phycisphaerae bacterium]